MILANLVEGTYSFKSEINQKHILRCHYDVNLAFFIIFHSIMPKIDIEIYFMWTNYHAKFNGSPTKESGVIKLRQIP